MANRLLSRPAPWLLLLALAVTTLLYWRGLYGPFLLDDPYGLQYVSAWREGKQPLWIVLFSNESMLMHRSLAMASFVLNIVVGGDSSFSFKVGNLLHHLATGVFVYLTVRQMLLRDARLATQSVLLSVLVTTLWLLHPLHVSTVLYVIQRMAQVASLCCFVGLWLYLLIRGRMQSATLGTTRGILWLWILIPLMTFLGIQGKQNAAVLPMLCLVLELAYFSNLRTMPTALRWFYFFMVVLPALVVCAALAMGLDQIYVGYWVYDFNLVERLLSESRALWVYVRDTLAPYPPGMGIYADDFVVSRGLLAPPTTLLSILGLAAVSAVAIRLRARMPSFFAGWFLFLIGHGVESTFLPLELYYEHRNYLPSVGLLICMVALLREGLAALQARGLRISRISTACALGAVLVLAVQTGGRVHVWSHLDTLLRSSVDAHPQSIHANYALLNSLLVAKRYDEIEQRLDVLSRSPDPRVRASALIYRMNVSCGRHRAASVDDFHAYLRLLPARRIELTTTQALSSFVDIAERKQEACGPVTFTLLGDSLAALADHAVDQPVDSFTRYTTRHQAARMYLAAGDSYKALVQARLAWQPPTPPTYCAALIRALLLQGHIEEAEQVLVETRKRINPDNPVDREGMVIMRRLIDDARAERANAKNASPPVLNALP